MAFVPLNTNNSNLANYNSVNSLMLDYSKFKNQNFFTPTGVMNIWLTNTAPKGWLICDGSAISRTQYSGLFAIIGTTYGTGDGSTTFNLPNLKGKVPVGRDSSQTEFDVLGETGGAKTHTLSITEMPTHSHTINAYTTNNEAAGYDLNTNGPGFENRVLVNTTGGQSSTNTGGGGAHNNLQPYIVINYIIKV